MADKPIEFAKYLHATLQRSTDKVDTIRWLCRQFDEFLSHNKAILAQVSQSTPRVSLAALSANSGPLGDSLMRFRCPYAVIDRQQHRRFAGVNHLSFNAAPDTTHTAVSTVSLADVMLAGLRHSTECLIVDFSIDAMEPTEPAKGARQRHGGERGSDGRGLPVPIGVAPGQGQACDDVGVAQIPTTGTLTSSAGPSLTIGLVCADKCPGKRMVDLCFAMEGAGWSSQGCFVDTITGSSSVSDSCVRGPSFTAGSVLSLRLERIRYNVYRLTLMDEALGLEDQRTIELAESLMADKCFVALECTGLAASLLVCVRPDPSFPATLPLSPTMSSREPSTIEHRSSEGAVPAVSDFALTPQGATASAVMDTIRSESLIRVECETFAEGANAVACDPAPMPGFAYVVSKMTEQFRVGVVLGTRDDAERKRLCLARGLTDVGLSLSLATEAANAAPGDGTPDRSAQKGGAIVLRVETRLPQFFSLVRRHLILPPSITASTQVALRLSFDPETCNLVLLDARDMNTMQQCSLLASANPEGHRMSPAPVTSPPAFPVVLAHVGVPGAGAKVHFACGCIGGGAVTVRRVASGAEAPTTSTN